MTLLRASSQSQHKHSGVLLLKRQEDDSGTSSLTTQPFNAGGTPSQDESSSPTDTAPVDDDPGPVVTSTFTIHNQYTKVTTYTEYTTETSAVSEAPASASSTQAASGLTIHSRDGIIITVLSTIAGVLFIGCSFLIIRRCIKNMREKEMSQHVVTPVSFHQSVQPSSRRSESRNTDISNSSRIPGPSTPVRRYLPPSPQTPSSHQGSEFTTVNGRISSNSYRGPRGSGSSTLSNQSSRMLSEPSRATRTFSHERNEIPLFHIPSRSRVTAPFYGERQTFDNHQHIGMEHDPPAYTPQSPALS